MTMHTPGPWTTDGKWSEEWEGVCINARQYVVVATAQYLGGTDPASANARLIAAAPEMLDALRQWQRAQEDRDAVEMVNAQLSRDAAIAKATSHTSA
jgi:predicted NAD-dependent protein-ADP-ribosyltransferase YbiA (DUF1768 family)